MKVAKVKMQRIVWFAIKINIEFLREIIVFVKMDFLIMEFMKNAVQITLIDMGKIRNAY